MTRTRKAILAGLVLAVVVVGLAIGALVHFWPHSAPGVPPELVPASWEQYRTSPGHMAHIEGEKAVCTDCHDYAREGFKNPGSAPCARCHAKEVSHAHVGNAQTKTDCLTCHVFAPDKQPPTCIGCHTQAEGHSAAITVHATAECASCHKLHESPSIAPAACAGCHGERDTAHARHAGSKECLDCHTGHAPAVAAIASCSGCHAQPAGPKPAGHDSCIGCHQPHDFVAGTSGCVGCHGLKATLVATEIEAHQACTNCHKHTIEEAVASCSHCHTGIQVAHGGKIACIGCHEPHGAKADSMVAVACTSCHTKVARSDTTAHARGVKCESCHEQHDFTPPDRQTLCVTCHASEVHLASTNKGHTDCATCHGVSTHEPTAAPACGTCHKAEQASAPPGHQKCDSCHEPHAGTVRPTATCASCHANKTAGPHAAVPGACATCHRPHGPSGVAAPPGCTTCHARDTLPALHTAPGHVECASCHTSHGPPRSDRTTCTGSCHVDKRDHQPQAQVCDGCHVFRH